MRYSKRIGTVVWKYKVLSALVGSLLLTIAWLQSESVRGRIAAEMDVRRERFFVLGFGLPPAWLPDYAKLLHDRYGIEYRAMAGCIVSQSLISYVDGYNSVSTAAINRKYQMDVPLETAEEAQRDWVRLHREKPTPGGIVEELFPYAPVKSRDIACFRSLSSGITMYQAVQRCGRPDEEVGSGIYIFLYHMDDGGIVSIGTPYLSRVDHVTYVDKKGVAGPHSFAHKHLPRLGFELDSVPINSL
jgi:hypothetical protein